MSTADEIINKFLSKSARTVVVGLGYVGLPLALRYAQAGFLVTGIERNPDRVAYVNRGNSYIEEVPDDALAPLAREKRICAMADFSGIAKADVIAICVPTPIDKNKQPDTSHIEYVLEQAQPHWHSGQLVLLESTTYPGTTEEVLVPHLTASGLEVGRDIFVAFSPERIDPGNKEFGVGDIPKIVGGVTDQCTEVVQCFYQQVLTAAVVPVSSPKVAEMTKLFENVFRVVNVSLVNELAQLCERMGIDVWEVIEAARTKPYGFMAFYPGPGVGGHCVPIDPYYLSWKAREYDFTPRFIDLAGKINDTMPTYVVERIIEVLNRYAKSSIGSRILLVGVAFKRDVADTRESAAVKVAEGLLERGAILDFHDPYVATVALDGSTYESVPLTAETLHAYDLVVVTTDHSNVDYQLIAESSKLIYDTRNAFSDIRAKHIYRLGVPKARE